MEERKVEAVRSWPVPTTIRDDKAFWGLPTSTATSLKTSAPSPLEGGPRKLVWSPAADEAFRLLKGRFTSAPLLNHRDLILPFVVEVDSSEVGMGAILSQRQGNPQKLYPCTYHSKKLFSAERNFDFGDRELQAVKLASEEWKH